MGILKKLFEKDPAPRVLDYILSNPDDLLVRHHIEKETGLSYATVERVIYDLVEKGLIVEEEVGERKVYRLNKKNDYAGKLLDLIHGRKLIENSPDALFLVEIDSKEIIDVNKSGEELLKLPREKIINQNFSKFVPSENSEEYEEIFEKFSQTEEELKEKKADLEELFITDSEDNRTPVEITGSGVINIGGLSLNQLIVRDISKRRKAEERFRRLFNSIPDPAFLIDKDGIIREINQSFHKRRKMDKEDIIGRHITELPFVPEEAEEKLWKKFEKRLSEGHVSPYTIRIEGPEGKELISEINASLIKEGNQIIGVIGISRDVTDRIHAEEKFRQLFHGFPDPSYLVDDEAVIVETNDAACEHLDLQRDEIIGSKPLDLVQVLDGEDEEKKMMERFEKVKKGVSVPTHEHKLRKPNGETYYAELNGVPFELNGKIEGVLIITHIITERKEMEKKLRENEKKYRTIAENAHDLISFIDFKGNILYANQTHEDLLGYKTEELVGENIFDFHHPDDVERINEKFEKGLLTKKELSVEARVKCKDGSYRWLNVLGKVLTDDSEGSDRILLVAHDLSEQKETEERLRKSKKRFKKIVETAPEPIMITDFEGKIKYCSPRTAEAHSYNNTEKLVGKSMVDLIAPKDREKAKEKLNETLEKEVSRDIELTLEKKNGSNFPATLSIGLVKDEEESNEGFVIIIRNILDLKKAEKKFKKLFEALPVPAYLVNKEGRLEEVNDAACERLGVEKEELIGEIPFKFMEIEEDTKEEMWKNFQKVIKGEESPTKVRKIKTLNGETVYSELTPVPFKLDGEIMGATFISRDVTDIMKEKQ